MRPGSVCILLLMAVLGCRQEESSDPPQYFGGQGNTTNADGGWSSSSGGSPSSSGSGSCTGESCASCGNGVQDGTESDVDCGGQCSATCRTGERCNVRRDCSSNLCTDGICTSPATCSNNEKDVGETDVDCGGPDCVPCALDQYCKQHRDCLSLACIYGKCDRPSCTDQARNGQESDVDCGGVCPDRCVDGKVCRTADDCQANGRCMGWVCVNCTNSKRDGDESDVDCGGTCPSTCRDGKMCGDATDCLSGRCENGRCISCNDGTRNGDEMDVDCGGSCSTHCGDGKRCSKGQDCTSGQCENGVCISCGDGTRNGDETDVDCGGSCSKDCANNMSCMGHDDCTGGCCMDGHCASNTLSTSCGPSCQVCPGTDHGWGVCTAGQCALKCNTGYHLCGGVCVSNTSVDSCGTSCSPCPTPNLGSSTCDGTTCGVSCPVGHHACGSSCRDNNDTGSCGNRCEPCPTDPNGVTGCDGTQCTLTCNPGTLLCQGACVSCPAGSDSTTFGCSGGQCVITGCAAGFRPCSGGCCAWASETIDTVGRTVDSSRVQVLPSLQLYNNQPAVSYGAVSNPNTDGVGEGTQIRYAIRGSEGWNTSVAYGSRFTVVAHCNSSHQLVARTQLGFSGTKARISLTNWTNTNSLFIAEGPATGGTFESSYICVGTDASQTALLPTATEIAFLYKSDYADTTYLHHVAWVTRTSSGWTQPSDVFTYRSGGDEFHAAQFAGSKHLYYSRNGLLFTARKGTSGWTEEPLETRRCTQSTPCTRPTAFGSGWLVTERSRGTDDAELLLQSIPDGNQVLWSTPGNGPIAADESGNSIHVVYITNSGTLMYVVVPLDGGPTLTSEISSVVGTEGAVAIKLDGLGLPHVVYHDSNTATLVYAH